MHTDSTHPAGFKRQVVFRISADEWPLLEAAAREHGSIQAAVLAGLHALAASQTPPTSEPQPPDTEPAGPPQVDPSEPPAAEEAPPEEEITAREAATALGLKTSTVKGYIRSGRLSGRYQDHPWRGWLTTRAAVNAYRGAAKRPTPAG